MDAALRRLMREMLDQVDTATDGLLGGQLSPVAWHNEVVGILGDYHTAAYLLGRDVWGKEERDTVLRLVAAQVGYLEGFTDAIESGRYEENADALRARACLYTGSVKETYSRAVTWGWDLPYYPTQGTECLVNCGCEWRISDKGNGDADCTWVRGKDDSCGTCREREGVVIRIRGGKRV